MSTIYNELNSLNVIARYNWDPVYLAPAFLFALLSNGKNGTAKINEKCNRYV